LEEAMRILTEGRGGHFDPALVDSFTGIAGSLYEEINGTGDNLLEGKLDELIDRYFSAGLQENTRLNCWEFIKCGREVGGAKAQELGVCPAYPDHGRHCAKNSVVRMARSVCPAYPDHGRHCARLVGTLCGGEVQGSFARKFGNCWKCPFFRSRHYDRMFRKKSGDLNKI
jgi:hypothetical protein